MQVTEELLEGAAQLLTVIRGRDAMAGSSCSSPSVTSVSVSRENSALVVRLED